MHRLLALLSALLSVLSLFAVSPAAAEGAPPAVEYQPPVDGPVVDDFRPPASDYAAGNRGVDFASAPGEPVRAAADGEVVFAGQVGGASHVVVLHADGLRSSLSFLSSVSVRRGDRVLAGDVVGAAAGPVHFGIRAGDEYLDPMAFLRGGDPEVHLAPLDPEDVAEGAEREALSRLLRAIGRTGLGAARSGVAWARRAALPTLLGDDDTARAWLSVARTLAVPEALRLAVAARDWHRRRQDCTPADSVPPPPPRRLLVLVGGLGSSGPDGASVFHFDHRGAGYRDEDVLRFSYLGGDARDHPYTPADTQQPIALSAARLSTTIRRLAAANPGVPIDVVAHSQGGLVSRTALTLAAGDPLPVSTFVTLGTPHGGASLATAGTLFRSTNLGDAVLDAAGRINRGGIDPQSQSVRELSEGSDLVAWLSAQPLPLSPASVVSVAARTDVVVPSPDCRLEGATNAVVTVGGVLDAPSAHDALPRSPEATREVALAVAGLPPTCESLADALTDALVGDGIEIAEDTVAASLGTAP